MLELAGFMELDVKNLSYGEVGKRETFELDLSQLDLAEDFRLESAEGEVVLTRVDEGLLAEFRIDPKVKLVCDRCQEEFIFEPRLKFTRLYALGIIDEDSDELPVSKNLTINTEEPIREEIVLAIPYKKLCDRKCKGICSNCGKNRNNEKCVCK